MATVKITINGVICDMYGRTITGPVKIVGEAMYTDVGVGGGPMPGGGGPVDPGYGIPERPVDPGYFPPRPAHPIQLPPIEPGGPPIDIGAHPEHPIVLPPEPEPPQPPQTVTVLKAPPPTGGWGAVSEYGWAYYPAQGAAGPKA